MVAQSKAKLLRNGIKWRPKIWSKKPALLQCSTYFRGSKIYFMEGHRSSQLYAWGSNEHHFLSFSYIYHYVFQGWLKGQTVLRLAGCIWPKGRLLRIPDLLNTLYPGYGFSEQKLNFDKFLFLSFLSFLFCFGFLQSHILKNHLTTQEPLALFVLIWMHFSFWIKIL